MPNELFARTRPLAIVAGRRAFFYSVLSGAALLTGAGAHGADPSVAETNLVPENISLWTESMLWDEQVTLSSGLGYKDNVLLSSFHPQGSGFFVNGLDCLALRVPLDGWQVEASLAGEDIRYWHYAGTSSEDSFNTFVRVQRELPGGWQTGLEVRGAYEKQVLDITPPAGIPATALVEGEALAFQPLLRKDLGPDWWLQLTLPVTRWWLAAPLDDNWEFGPVITAGYAPGERSEVTVSYGASCEDHDSWTALADSHGRFPLPQSLEIFQNRAELAWHQYWDAHHRWRSATALVFAGRTDNGGGYYNEYQYELVEELRWQTADWLLKGGASLTYEDYPVQWTGAANGNTLYRDLWDLSAEVERRLFKGMKGYVQWQYQRSLSNEELGAYNYRAGTISGGIRWEF